MRSSSLGIAGVLIAVLGLGVRGQAPESNSTQASEPPASEAKGMPPRATPGDYQAQGKAGAVTIAAEFAGHSVPRAQGPLSTEEYVVVETAFFGASGQRLKLSLDDFSLNINGKKTPLASQPYVLVVKSVKDPEWVSPEEAEGKTKSSSKGGLSTGGAQADNGPPPPVHVPIQLQRAMAQDVKKAALPEGDRALPVAGLLFFQYRGKTKSIRSLELIYSGAAGRTALKLEP